MSWLHRNGGGDRPVLPPLPPMAAPAASDTQTGVFASSDDLGTEAERLGAIGDWRGAASRLHALVERDPTDAAAWLDYARAAARGGLSAEAIAACERTIALDPDNGVANADLGDLHRLAGSRDAAVAAYAEALRIDPTIDAAHEALIRMGARDAIPEAALDRKLAWARTSSVAVMLAEADRARSAALTANAYPLAAYDRFRREIPIRPPPTPIAAETLTVVVDCTTAAPAFLRSTLRSLIGQSIIDWQAWVIAPPAIHDHPVASFAAVDGRIRFADPAAALSGGRIVSLSAGTILDPEALAWLAWTAERTGAALVTCDQDRAIEHWRHGVAHADPILSGVFDAALLETSAPPAILLMRQSTEDFVPGAEGRRALAIRAAATGPVAHVPRLLASVLDLGLIAEGGVAVEAEEAGLRAPAATLQTRPAPVAHHASAERLLVVIPTRDSPALLAAALASLRRHAAHPERIDFRVVDNRSSGDETRELLAAERAARRIDVLAMDEPFNWSRANNIAAAGATQDVLVFVNDDTEMLTTGWDVALLAALDRPGVGAVGARLLYPDGTLQHAGILLGGYEGMPIHAGAGAAGGAPGPGGRWRQSRSVGAVTGAFLAVRRMLFEELGGFDEERFFVGYNDVDFCLRIRERGRTIRYAADIELTHHESKTRGLNDTRARVAWDQGELSDMNERWGGSLTEDPSYSPYWATGGVPYDGIREPGMGEIVRWIDASARPDPWLPTRRDEQLRRDWEPDRLA